MPGPPLPSDAIAALCFNGLTVDSTAENCHIKFRNLSNASGFLPAGQCPLTTHHQLWNSEKITFRSFCKKEHFSSARFMV